MCRHIRYYTRYNVLRVAIQLPNYSWVNALENYFTRSGPKYCAVRAIIGIIRTHVPRLRLIETVYV